MRLTEYVCGFTALLAMLIGIQEPLFAKKGAGRPHCSHERSSPDAQFPYPPHTLEGENCHCCFEAKKRKFSRLTSRNVTCINHNKLCKFLAKPIPDIWNIANINTNKLFITPNPPISVPPGQQVSFPPKVPIGDQIPLAGRNVLVVGGSKGIGQAIAERFSSEGAHVIATSRHPECYHAPTGYLLWQVDVRIEKDVEKLIKKVAKHFHGKIDIVVLASAVSSLGPLSDYNGDSFLNALDTGLAGYQRVVHYALPYMRHTDTTRVISIGSLQAYINSPFALPVYAILKRALQSWNNQHMTDEVWKKAQGLVANGPTFSLAEPFTFPTSTGVYENYLPGRCSALTDPLIHGGYLTAQGITFDILALDDLQTVMAEQIFRIAVAPQPGVRYVIIEESILAPLYLPLLQESNLVSATDQFNLVQEVVGIFNVTAIKDSQTLYQQSFCDPD